MKQARERQDKILRQREVEVRREGGEGGSVGVWRGECTYAFLCTCSNVCVCVCVCVHVAGVLCTCYFMYMYVPTCSWTYTSSSVD